MGVLFVALALALTPRPAPSPEPEVVVTQDDTVIERSCTVVIPAGTVIRDANGDGVIHIKGKGLRVAFRHDAVLRGAPETLAHDQLQGIGIRIEDAPDVVISGCRVQGFKVGLRAISCPRLVVEDAAFENNFRQHLRSTVDAEDGRDWLGPHENDEQKWRDRYGAALCIESSEAVVVRRVRVRRGQNGILLDRVDGAKVYDNDCSFLSGWGIALWRSSRNVIARNALDFCVRGYSHGVYNRGQDSAGLLMFEQCSGNVIAENSITHGGDGVFGFTGKEALSGSSPRGCNRNLFLRNDLSFAAAHGLEMTFSFENRIFDNRFIDNAICGIWAGYSQGTLITDNLFERNGEMAYGLERGGVNIEHGTRNRIEGNTFRNNRCGVHLWNDPDPHLMKEPWVKANHRGCRDEIVVRNTFSKDDVAVHLRDARDILVDANRMEDVVEPTRLEAGATLSKRPPPDALASPKEVDLPGETRPVGARRSLAGRQSIIMTDWGPWDHASPLARLAKITPDAHVYELYRVKGKLRVSNSGKTTAQIEHGARSVITVRAREPGVCSYELSVTWDGYEKTLPGHLIDIRWDVTFFPWTKDPREDLDGWLKESDGESAVKVELKELRFPFGGRGPAALGLAPTLDASGIGDNRFGTIATTRLPLTAGTWKIRTVSDDGVRVLVDNKPLIDNWTHHGATPDEATFELKEDKTVSIEVLYFEIDGGAVLTFEIEPAS